MVETLGIPQPAAAITTGVVRYYNDAKGFGLITPDIFGPSLFAHAAEIRSGGKKLKAAQRVSFVLEMRTEGPTAAQIRVLD